MDVVLHIQMRRSLLFMFMRRLMVGLNAQQWETFKQTIYNWKQAVTLPCGAKLQYKGGGWFTVHGYHYAGDDVKAVKNLMEYEYNELGFACSSVQEPVPPMTLNAYLDGKKVTWW